MRLPDLHKRPKFYWTIHLFLAGPLILLWGGVAYWFSYSSGILLKIVFPPMLAPALPILLLICGFVWTVAHLRSTPSAEHTNRGVDILICGFILFSMILVFGQMMTV